MSQSLLATTPIGWTVAFTAFPIASMAQSMITLQCLQAEALLQWHKELAAASKEMQDQWICHWAGGVPIGA